MPSDIQKSLSKGKKLKVGGVTLCQWLPDLSAVGNMESQAEGGPRQVMILVRGPSGPSFPTVLPFSHSGHLSSLSHMFTSCFLS